MRPNNYFFFEVNKSKILNSTLLNTSINTVVSPRLVVFPSTEAILAAIYSFVSRIKSSK